MRLLLPLLSILIGMGFSTQDFASKVHYDAHFIGSPLVTLFGMQLYTPWKIFTWYKQYHAFVPELFSMYYIIIGVILAILFLWITKPTPELTSHGSARWAVYKDLLKMDLMSGSGVTVGLYDSAFKRTLTKGLRKVELLKNENVSYAERNFDKERDRTIDRHISRLAIIAGLLDTELSESKRKALLAEQTQLEAYCAKPPKYKPSLFKNTYKSVPMPTISIKKGLTRKQVVTYVKGLCKHCLAVIHGINYAVFFPGYEQKALIYSTIYKRLNKAYKYLPHFYLRDNSNKHMAVIAPTRSGKGVGLIIPTLLGGWQESVIVNDIKSENWGITAGYRKRMGQLAIKFEPTASDGSSARWNPIDEIPLGNPMEVSMAQNLAAVIADYEGKGKPDHWTANAATVIMCVILHLKYAHLADPKNYPHPPSLYTVANFMKASVVEKEDGTLDMKGFVDTLKSLANFEHVPDSGIDIPEWDNRQMKYVTRHFTPEDMQAMYPGSQSLQYMPNSHPIIFQSFAEITAKPDNELGSIVSTANTALKEYLDPVLAQNTSVSDFCIDDLMNHEKPISLYLVTPPSDLLRLAPIFRLFFEMMVRHHARDIGTYINGQAKSKYKHKCLFLMDEFSSLGNLQSFAATLSYIAGYGMKVFLINQGLPQINGIYGKDNQILMNCHLQIFYAPNDNDTGKYAESLLGNKTILVKSKSSNSNGSLFSSGSTSTSATARALMTSDELKRLGDQEIIVASGSPPVLTDKIKYYENKYFLDRLLQAPVASDVVRTDPVYNAYPKREALLASQSKQKNKEITSFTYRRTTLPSPSFTRNENKQ